MSTLRGALKPAIGFTLSQLCLLLRENTKRLEGVNTSHALELIAKCDEIDKAYGGVTVNIPISADILTIGACQSVREDLTSSVRESAPLLDELVEILCRGAAKHHQIGISHTVATVEELQGAVAALEPVLPRR